MVDATPRGAWRHYFNVGTLPFWGIHAAAVVGVWQLGWSWQGFALAAALYAARMFFVTGVYHRYFSHRTYKTSRWFQLVLAVGAIATAQKGVLWWSGHHRRHHRDSDTPRDVHSPRQHGFWWSHLGWILSPTNEATRFDEMRDMARFPELRFLDRFYLLPPIALAVLLALLGGWHAVVWGMFVSTVLCWHGTFTINSLAHLIGRRPYETEDDSRNNWVLAVITMGEGWHNNHHHFMVSVNQGFRWWELDMTYYLLRLLAAVGLIWDLKHAPRHVIEQRSRRIAGGRTAPAAPTGDRAAA
jgi:stearoyl-CoA desaturase (delta-9 desaturase)